MNKRIFGFMSEAEYDIFTETINQVASKFPDILGILGVGSLMQPQNTPVDFFVSKYKNDTGAAYESVRNPNRRRLSTNDMSDLDLWICIRDTQASKSAQNKVDLGGIALLGELASKTLSRGTPHWKNKKEATFRYFYKQSYLYPKTFLKSEGEQSPWMAENFKSCLEISLIKNLPHVVSKINASFKKQIPGNFLEVRAFPESLFNLRPDDCMLPDGQEDRSPFPRIADDQWLGTSHSSVVLYSTNEVTIYPFVKNGIILGSSMVDSIKNSVSKNKNSHFSYTGLLIKPDAIKKDQVNIIMSKIVANLAMFNATIIFQKEIESLSESDVETLYPLLHERELKEVKDYLVGGRVIVLIIKAPLSNKELFKKISILKGPRLVDRSYGRLIEGRILDGSIRDLLPVPGEEVFYEALIKTILAKKSNPDLRFSDGEYRYYAQNLIHSPDNDVELNGLFKLANYFPE